MAEPADDLGDGDLQSRGIVAHHMVLEDAVRGYEVYDDEQSGCRQVFILLPCNVPT